MMTRRHREGTEHLCQPLEIRCHSPQGAIQQLIPPIQAPKVQNRMDVSRELTETDHRGAG